MKTDLTEARVQVVHQSMQNYSLLAALKVFK